MPKIEELWVYPVKACRGVRVDKAKVLASGLQYDRQWCVVDLEGTIIARCEAVSQRKLPALATVEVSMAADSSLLRLNAPGMPTLELPTDAKAYDAEPMVMVQASGVSTTDGGGWWLGQQAARQSTAGSAWLNGYLNRSAGDLREPSLLISGKTKPATFALCYCPGKGIEMASYPPIFPLTAQAANDPRFAGNTRKFADFAPFLLVNQSSADYVAQLASANTYPIGSFRGNIVVRTASAWEEETWARATVRSPGDGALKLSLDKIKECPRCTVPCRDGFTGGWIFPEDKLKLWKVLKKVFPGKFGDKQWGTWSGAFFGVYFGHHGVEGAVLKVGDVIEVETWTRWDAHLKSSSALLAFLRNSVALQLVLAVAAAAAAALAFAALQQGVLP